MSKATVTLTLRIAPEVGTALADRALTEGTSVNALVERIVRETLKEMAK